MDIWAAERMYTFEEGRRTKEEGDMYCVNESCEEPFESCISEVFSFLLPPSSFLEIINEVSFPPNPKELHIT
jgi:hypothetical protein